MSSRHNSKSFSQSYNPLDEYPPTRDFELPPYQIDNDNSESDSDSEDEEDSPNDNDILLQATSFTHHIPPPLHTHPTLSKPVAIPQTLSGIGSAYARCYSPQLASYNITESDFVSFINNLNVVASANPPLQVLNLVGIGIGLAPHWIFTVAGIGIQAVAKIGTVIVSKSRTDIYMKMVNAEVFAPRGLKAIIVDREIMGLALGIPDGLEKLSPVTDENLDVSVLERRLENLRPYISELHFDVPPPTQQTTVLRKMSAAQVKWQTEKAEKKALKRRKKLMKEGEKRSRKERKLEGKAAEKRARQDWERGRSTSSAGAQGLKDRLAEIGVQRREVEREFVNNTRMWKESFGDMEGKAAKKALWILIEEL